MFHPGALEFYGNVNFLKGGLVYSDYLTTVSKRYAQEIQTPEFGYGLDGVVRAAPTGLSAFLNGVDYSAWDPDTDKLIRHELFREGPERKASVQAALLEPSGLLPRQATRPVIGIVSRFADQKGFDLIADAPRPNERRSYPGRARFRRTQVRRTVPRYGQHFPGTSRRERSPTITKLRTRSKLAQTCS